MITSWILWIIIQPALFVGLLVLIFWWLGFLSKRKRDKIVEDIVIASTDMNKIKELEQ